MTEDSASGFRLVAASAEIANDTVVPRYLRERKAGISIARVDGRLYAFDGLCRFGHEPCPLSGGLLTGPTVMCQCHGSRFDITTGTVLNGPATEPLTVYEVKEIAGHIQIREVPMRAPEPVSHRSTRSRWAPEQCRNANGRRRPSSSACCAGPGCSST